MKYVYENHVVKSKLVLCNALESEAGLLEDKTFYKFIWVKEGEVELIINHKHLTFHAGEIVCLSCLHHLKLGTINGNYRAMLFNDRFYHIIDHNDGIFSGLLFNGSLDAISFPVPKEEVSKLNRLTDVFLEELAVKDSRQDEMLRIVLKRTVIICCRLARKQQGLPAAPSARFEVMQKFHALVDEHFREKKRVQDYAGMLCKSPQALASILAHYRRPSAIKIIHNRIIAEAEHLLHYTSQTSKEIAFALGFENPASFSRFFKNKTGISATEFRSRRKKRERRT
jgi:AraC-like DNA-binding protein